MLIKGSHFSYNRFYFILLLLVFARRGIVGLSLLPLVQGKEHDNVVDFPFPLAALQATENLFVRIEETSKALQGMQWEKENC